MVRHFDLSKYTETGNLLGCEQGQRVLAAIQEELNRLPAGGILLLDFRNIRDATPACLIEILTAIDKLKQLEFQDKYLILKLERANVDLKTGLSLVLKEKKCVIPNIDENGNWEVLGELTKAQKETIEFIKERGEVTSREISQRLNLPIGATSNRLRDLYHLRLVTREERSLNITGGRQFVYRCLCG
jgi:predicted transcriptional regulator